MTTTTANANTVRQARARYFLASGFDETNYDDTWVELPVGRFHVYMPNLPARRRVLGMHDVHHALTGYRADWPGEFEISSWEIGASCGRYWFAWLVNTQGMMLGIFAHFTRMAAAFARGRRSKSLYTENVSNVLQRDVDWLRRRLQVAAVDTVPSWRDKLLMGGYVALAWLLTLGVSASLLWATWMLLG